MYLLQFRDSSPILLFVIADDKTEMEDTKKRYGEHRKGAGVDYLDCWYKRQTVGHRSLPGHCFSPLSNANPGWEKSVLL